MIKAVIFDMDGLLINSEPYWKQAEIDVFEEVGVDLTWEMAKSTSGMREDETIGHWFRLYPWRGATKEEVLARIHKKVVEKVQQKGESLPGVMKTISLLKDNHVPMAIASASMLVIINAVVDKLDIRKYMQVIYSAEHEEYGKPHPGVYITTAKMLDLLPADCLALEDSPRGVLAAKAAKMHCIAVPEKNLISDKRFGIADAVLSSLEDFNLALLSKF